MRSGGLQKSGADFQKFGHGDLQRCALDFLKCGFDLQKRGHDDFQKCGGNLLNSQNGLQKLEFGYQNLVGFARALEM